MARICRRCDLGYSFHSKFGILRCVKCGNRTSICHMRFPNNPEFRVKIRIIKLGGAYEEKHNHNGTEEL